MDLYVLPFCMTIFIIFSQGIAALWDVETFPWLVAIGFMNDENSSPSLLCSGAAVSKFVLVAPAHCISGVQKSRLVILSAGYRYSSATKLSITL